LPSIALAACWIVLAIATISHAQPLRSSDGRAITPSNGDSYSKVSVFGIEAPGRKFVYVFDRSSSMEGAPLAAAKSQLIKSISTIDELQQFHIIFFNQRLLSLNVASGRQRIAFATDRNKKQAVRFINQVKADGATDRYLALKHAIALQPDVIFFLSDADDPMTPAQLSEVARVNERVGAKICTIEFGAGSTPPKSNFLTDLAAQTGGKYAYVDIYKLPP
jgi:uncharacterized protein with von Willebrand factor type A (vWA) domain